MVSRRDVLKTMAGAAATMVMPPASPERQQRPARDKPNLLFLWADEMRADVLEVNGNFRFHMPVLNHLGSQSTVFRNTYVAQPICTPSRGCILSGLYPHQHGAIENKALLDRSIQLQPELLGDSAYRTGYMGKFHLGDEVFPQHGFQDWVSTEDEYIDSYYPDRDQSARSSYHSYLVTQEHQPNNPKKNVFTRDYAVRLPLDQCKPAFQARNASRFILENRNQPWLLHVSFLEPHMPFYGPYNDFHTAEEAPVPANYPGDQIDHEPAYYKRLRQGFVTKGYEGQDLHTRPGWQRLNRNYAGLCTQVDQALAQILWALEASGQSENTIIVFTSDHGEMMGSHSLIGKSVFYEEAVRVPLFIRVPGQQKQVLIDNPISQVNLVPTLLELLGKKAPEKLPGESLLPLVHGGKLKEDHVFIEWQESKSPSGRAIISPQREKLVLFQNDNNMYTDTRKDPLELNNLYYGGSQEKRITELHKRVDTWQKRVGDTLALDS